MTKPVLEVRDAWLSYRVFHRRHETLKAAILSSLRGKSMGEASEFEAIKGISFEVERGEVLGVIGRNGSGKSTLLRMLAGIQKATRGEVLSRGRVGSILTLVGGFHPDSTGRDNIYLNCLLLGLGPDSAAAKMESIIEFAELGDFIDAPVRTYSTGMRGRLGFAVAAHLDADVILVDEVLSVGDAHFERKCERWLESKIGGDVAMVLVSHDLAAVERLCDRVLWLEQGKVRGCGPAKETLKAYREAVD